MHNNPYTCAQATAFYEYETFPDTDDELMAEELGGGSGSELGSVGGAASGGDEITSQRQAGAWCFSFQNL